MTLPFRIFITRILAPLVVVMLMLPSGAHADKVDRLIKQLTSSSDYKVRLSAALSLSKQKDPRSITAFVRALRDKDKTVRGVAAASLGKLVTSSTPKGVRNLALVSLKKVAAKDNNSFVRKQAKKAYRAVKELGASAGGIAKAGSTYVNIGNMSAKTPNASKMRKLMRRTTRKTFQKKASQMVTQWPGGSPSKKQLKSKKVKAFHVDATLNELKVTARGSSRLISCKVSMLLATYPEKSMFGFLNGGAKVQAGSSERDVGYAKEDCVAAVIESLVATKIIPTIKTRSK